MTDKTLEFSVKSGDPEKQRSACLVAGVYEGRKLSAAARRLDEAGSGALGAILRRGDLEGKSGQSLLLHNLPGVLCERVLLMGCGKEKDFHEGRYRDTLARAARILQDTGAGDAVLYLTELEVRGRDIRWKLRQAVETVEDALYRFDRLKSEKSERRRALRKIILPVAKRSDLGAGEQAIEHGRAVAAGVTFTKDLGNLPGNMCTPSHLAEQAVELGKQFNLKVSVLDQAEIQALGMGSFMAVARGSRQPPKLIVLEYHGGREGEAPIALVGKGITFDSGGLSIKPSGNMDEMKFDMCGAASVLGTFKSLALLRLPINVVGVIPSCENLPGGDAIKPGDIVTSMSGQTIEILNTDAEGRLILCDALTYTERFHPAAVVDVATLTGACVVALGTYPSGLMSNHDALARELINAGKYAWDRAWQLPLWDEYQKLLDSNFADVANISGGREGGAITAACFLARFTKKFKWAHLDIAGTAWKTGKDKGATGRPVPLLVTFLLHRAEPRVDDTR